jgi:hypothetical protein
VRENNTDELPVSEPCEENENEDLGMIDGPEPENKDVLIQSGPHRWTPATLLEYVKQYRHLEGKLWIHPRTRRLYEITTVFYFQKEKCAAAYSRVMDGGQPDTIDQHPFRLDGKAGLIELVADFELKGGSLGLSKTPWPTSQEEWATHQENDLHWGPLITELKQVYQINECDLANSSTSNI